MEFEEVAMSSSPDNLPCSGIRCGIVLSAGSGTRMRDFVHRLRGHDLPKQYVNFIGKRSMLEHTFDRAEKLIPAERLYVVIAREHLEFSEVSRQVGSRSSETVVIQPKNKDTAPGLLLPLIYLHRRYPDAAVAIFPSDHFIVEEDVFIRHVDLAFQLVEQDGSRIVLLGVEPNAPEPEYGYIVPGEKIKEPGLASAKKVEMFVEKPAVETAKKIVRIGALWNTLVMVFQLTTLMNVFRRATPELYRSFQPILKAISTPDEQRVLDAVYHELNSINFSTAVLEVLPFEYRQDLLVLPVRGVTWSDWGSADRLLTGMKKMSQVEN
jgi:mannose-1-phosphate guanylyltransferase